MLSEVLSASSSTGQAGALSRARASLVRARTVEELRGTLTALLESVYRAGSRCELFLSRDGQLAPALRPDGIEGRRSRGLLATVRTRLLASRRPLTEPQALAAHQTSGRRPVLSAPILSSSDELLGLIIVEGAPHHPPFDRLELVALEGVAALLAGAPAVAPAERTGGSRRDLDGQAASRLQRDFMSSRLPSGIGVTAHAEYLPAFDVGGDFYSVSSVADGSVYAVIGDVSGNGVSAALLMSRVTADVERAVASGARPAAVLATLNADLERRGGDMFVTAACVRIDPARRRLTVASAGHLPLVVRGPGGEVFTFGGASGTPLGMLPCDYAEDELLVDPGCILLLMTDGLLEALDPPTGHRGVELLLDEVQSIRHDPAAISARLRDAVEGVRAEHPLDDVTWLTLQLAR